jgi:hypothetical protein
MPMNPSIPLMNFRIPRDLKDRFQQTCRTRRTRMSSELIRLVNQFLRADQFENDESQRRRDSQGAVTRISRTTRRDPDTGLPIID